MRVNMMLTVKPINAPDGKGINFFPLDKVFNSSNSVKCRFKFHHSLYIVDDFPFLMTYPMMLNWFSYALEANLDRWMHPSKTMCGQREQNIEEQTFDQSQKIGPFVESQRRSHQTKGRFGKPKQTDGCNVTTIGGATVRELKLFLHFFVLALGSMFPITRAQLAKEPF